VTAGWELLVLGKGQKERIVSVPDAVVAKLSCYLVARGLDADPESTANRGAHLIGKAAEPPAWSAVAQTGIARKPASRARTASATPSCTGNSRRFLGGVRT